MWYADESLRLGIGVCGLRFMDCGLWFGVWYCETHDILSDIALLLY